jgi:hypothetical protein
MLTPFPNGFSNDSYLGSDHICSSKEPKAVPHTARETADGLYFENANFGDKTSQ